MHRRQRLVERRQQLSDRSAYFAGQRATLVEIDRVCPGPDALHLDAGTQVSWPVATSHSWTEPFREVALSLLRLDGHSNIAAANRHHARDPQRTLRLLQTS